jgi:hypothetical protein
MHSWLASARLRRETASAWWLVWSCSGGYPGVPRGGGELRVACAAPPTAVPASVGAGGVCNTREARTPCWARSRAGLSDLFVAYPPTARPRRLLRPPRTTPNPPAPPPSPQSAPHPSPRCTSPVLAPFCPCSVAPSPLTPFPPLPPPPRPLPSPSLSPPPPPSPLPPPCPPSPRRPFRHPPRWGSGHGARMASTQSSHARWLGRRRGDGRRWRRQLAVCSS